MFESDRTESDDRCLNQTGLGLMTGCLFESDRTGSRQMFESDRTGV